MKVFERTDLQTRMIRNMRARSPELTYFGPGPLRAFLYAVAVELQHLYYRLFRADLKQDALRALGSDLDDLAAARGVTRLGAAAASAVLQFTGTLGTVIPIGFQVQSSTGVTYSTTESGTITQDSSNPGTSGIVKLIAQSTSLGAGSQIPRGSLTLMVNAGNVTGGTLSAVTNLAPSVGGGDAETDELLRSRVINQLAVLNQGTRAFYETQLRLLDPTIVRVYVGRGLGLRSVRVAIVARSGALYTNNALSSLATSLSPYVPAQTSVEMTNLIFTPITVSFTGSMLPGYADRDVTEQIARNISAFMDWTLWPFGQTVHWSDLEALVLNTTGVDTLVASSFVPALDTPIPANSLPRLTSITFTDVTTSTTTTLGSLTAQFPRLA